MEKHNIGALIKELRDKNHFTQTQLARSLGVSRTTVNNWEINISEPKLERIGDLCSILHTTPDYLLGISTGETICIENLHHDEKEALYKLIKAMETAAKTSADSRVKESNKEPVQESPVSVE